jgi:tRNA(Ile)-lysidine synthase
MEIQNNLSKECNIPHGAVIVVGLSGGADSMALTHLLHTNGYQVIPAHFAHGLRENSMEDADAASAACAQLGLQLHLGGADVQTYCKVNRKGIEEGARELRYYFLFTLAKHFGAQAVAVAHHADDQVETILMHFIRGAGLSGLKGMPYRNDTSQFSSDIPLIRPLLSTTHAELVKYCVEHQIQYVEDPSNQKDTFFRNRLRHQIIPLLEEQNPAFRQAVLRSSISLQADHAWMESLVEEEIQNLGLIHVDGCVGISLMGLMAAERGLRWNILRKIIADNWPGLRDFDMEALQRLDDLVLDPVKKTVDLVEHIKATSLEGILWLHRDDQLPPVLFSPQIGLDDLHVEIPCEIELENGWKLVIEVDTVEMPSHHTAEPFEAWLDGESIQGRLFLRRKLPGEKMSPLGMHGLHARLADLFINAHIEEAARQAYPLVCDEGGVVWLPGVTIADRCRVTEKSRQAFHLRFIRKDKTG